MERQYDGYHGKDVLEMRPLGDYVDEDILDVAVRQVAGLPAVLQSKDRMGAFLI